MVPPGSLEAGTLAHWFGTPVAIAIGAVVCAIAALVTLRAVRRRDAAEATVSAAATVD
jgi:hypothetical protein